MSKRPRISAFKIGTCENHSFRMTSKGISDAKNAELNNYSKKILAQEANKSAKEKAEAALDWLLNANNKSPKFILPC